MIGFFDGLNNETKQMLEIKTSSTPWSIGKFQSLIQRKIYSLARPDITEIVCITATRDPKEWEAIAPKSFTIPMTRRDREEAMEWILAGIRVLESGSFSGGLDESGRCNDQWCYFGKNCSFK
jgi:hypothetical protein